MILGVTTWEFSVGKTIPPCGGLRGRSRNQYYCVRGTKGESGCTTVIYKVSIFNLGSERVHCYFVGDTIALWGHKRNIITWYPDLRFG